MKELVENLIFTLEKEDEIYNEILNLSKSKKKIIIDGKFKELEKITEKEKGIVLSLIKIEEAREKVVNKILKKLDILEIENISELLKYLDDENRLKVRTAKNKLMNTISSAGIENDFNKKLLEQSLDLIEFNLDILTTYDNSGGNYLGNAKDEEKEKKNIFDMKV